jgi:hypothetical protein
MTATLVRPVDTLASDLAAACAELGAARAGQRRKDTPAARRQVADCRDRIDRLLDAWNATRRG